MEAAVEAKPPDLVRPNLAGLFEPSKMPELLSSHFPLQCQGSFHHVCRKILPSCHTARAVAFRALVPQLDGTDLLVCIILKTRHKAGASRDEATKQLLSGDIAVLDSGSRAPGGACITRLFARSGRSLPQVDVPTAQIRLYLLPKQMQHSHLKPNDRKVGQVGGQAKQEPENISQRHLARNIPPGRTQANGILPPAQQHFKRTGCLNPAIHAV